jgi:hypothetical protein
MPDDAQLQAWIKSLSTNPPGQPNLQQAEADILAASPDYRRTQAALSPRREAPKDFIARNQRNIPIELGLQSSSDIRTALLMRERPEDKVKYLEQFVGQGNVRLADDGTPLVTVYDAERKMPVEFPPLGTGANIIPHAQALIPETAAAIAGQAGAGRLLAKAPRFFRFIGEMAGAAAGQEAAGTAKDIALSSTPLDEIIAERAGRLPTDIGLNVGLGLGASALVRGGGKILSPFGGTKGEIETGIEEAAKYFQEKFGVDYPRTAGERIGSSIFKRVEATLSREPGASAHFRNLQERRVEAYRQIQNKMLASKIDPADVGMLRRLEEDIGEDAIAALRTQIEPIQNAERIARDKTAQAAETAVMSEVASATGPTRQIYPEKVGQNIRVRVAGDRDKFLKEAGRRYEEVYALEGGTDKILEPPNLVTKAKELLKEQPSPEITTTKPSAIVGPTGSPIMVTTKGTPIQREFVPEGVMPILESLAKMDRAKFSLRDLVKMRTEVRNGIARGKAIPGVDTHYLGEIEDALTGAIEESTAALPTSALKDAWQGANKFYREGDVGFAKGVKAFDDRNIARLFKEREMAGFVQDEDIIRNIGPSEYQSFKQFLGADSPEFGNLKRAILDDLLINSQLSNSERLDGAALARNIDKFVRKNRSVAEDILAPEQIARLDHLGGILEALGKEGVPIEPRAFTAALSGSGDVRAAFKDLMAKQRELNGLYRSKILKDIGAGKLGKDFDSTEFIDRFFGDASPRELEQIKGLIEKKFPETWEDLQRKMGERILQRAQRKVGGLEASRLEPGAPFRPPSETSLEAVFGDEQNKARLRVMLGDEKMEDLKQLALLLRGGEAAERAFAGSGGMSAQMQIHQMFRGGVLSYLSDYLKQKMAAIMYFNPTIEKLLSNQIGRSPEAQVNLIRTIVASQPFISAMESDFKDKAGLAIGKVLAGIDTYEEQGPPGKQALAQQEWINNLIDRNRPRVVPIKKE